MATCYVAGPMRGIPLFNFPAFDRASRFLRNLGWEVISPADLDRESGINETEELVLTPAIIREFVTRDTRALLSLRPESGDAIALLPGWQRSTGAKAELAVARWLGLKIIDARTGLELDARVEGHEVRSPPPAEFRECYGGQCGIEHDLAVASTIRIAEDFANREVI